MRGYHVGNLIVHLLAAFALFGVARRTLGRLANDSSAAKNSAPLALGIALLWAVHPLLTSSVTYLSQRTESLMGLCYLGTLYGFVRATDSASSRAWLLVSVVTCALGMATKESMVTAPVLVLLYDRTFIAGTFAAAWRIRWRYYVLLASTWLLLALLMRGGLAQRQVGFGLGIGISRYALTECHAILLYLRLAVWPHPLVFDYGASFSDFTPIALGEAIIVLALVAASLFLLIRRPRLGFFTSGFFLLLAPTSSVVPVALQPIGENRTYLPLAILSALAVVGLYTLLARRSYVVVGLLATGLGILTIQRNATYQSTLTLWADTVAHRPENARAHANFALTLSFAGRTAEAIPVYERALQLEPSSAVNHGMYADALLALGRTEDAIAEYRRALHLDPAMVGAGNNLGVALLRAGHPEAAVTHLRVAIRARPTDLVAHENLGLALATTGHLDEATAEFEATLTLQPDNAAAHFEYGNFLSEHQLSAAAMVQYRAVLRLQPEHAGALFRLGFLLMQAANLDEAAICFAHGLRLQPDFAEAYNNYGAVLYRLGRTAEAIVQFEQALHFKPDYPQARQNLAVARSGSAPR